MSDKSLVVRLANFRRWALVAAVIGAMVCGLDYYFRPARFFPAYLSAWLFWWGISSGSLAISMIHHLSGGAWGQAIRRPLESASELMPLMAILFVPVWLGMSSLYEWTDAERLSAEPALQAKTWYLNETGFMVRAVIYFVSWSLLAAILNRLSVTRNGNGYGRLRALAVLSGPGLVVWGLAVTFASIDWVMSLEPHWSSTTFGVLIAAGQAVGAMSLTIAVLVLSGEALPSPINADLLNDLGNFLLAFVMFWAYISFTQFLIIWSGNLPEEIPWYLVRARGGWQWLAVLLAGFHFGVPFLLLLARHTKRQPRRLLTIALLLLAMRILDWHWLVMPTFAASPLDLSLSNIAAPIAIGGLWLAAFTWRLAVRAELPLIVAPEEAHA